MTREYHTAYESSSTFKGEKKKKKRVLGYDRSEPSDLNDMQ